MATTFEAIARELVRPSMTVQQRREWVNNLQEWCCAAKDAALTREHYGAHHDAGRFLGYQLALYSFWRYPPSESLLRDLAATIGQSVEIVFCLDPHFSGRSERLVRSSQ